MTNRSLLACQASAVAAFELFNYLTPPEQWGDRLIAAAFGLIFGTVFCWIESVWRESRRV